MAWSAHPRTDAWTDAMVELDVLVADDPPDGSCSVCGRLPAGPVHFTAIEGYALAFRWRRFARPCCHSCAIGTFREHQARTWARGFWGVPALLVAPVVLAVNLRRLRRSIADLAPPRPTQAGVEPGLRGRAVWLRRATYGPLAVTLLALVAWVALTGRTVAVAGLRPGDCFDVPAETAFGPGAGAVRVEPADCRLAHSHEVVARLQHPAPAGAAYPGLLDLDEAAFAACIADVPPEISEAGDLSLGVAYPTPTDWERGERTLTCVVTSRTGPLRGSVSR